MKIIHGLAVALVFLAPRPAAHAAENKIAVVAAENFYGDIARQIGGERVAVVSIMNNPDEDPHLFETTPGVVRRIAGAQIAILNGANYDPWMEKLLSVVPQLNRQVIIAAHLVHRKAGDNPHLWYDPATMPAIARAIAAAFTRADRTHAADYAAQLAATLASLDRIAQRAAQIKARHAGSAVTATEPVFGYMAEALGLTMRNQSFQLAVMNDSEPSARDIAAFEKDLKEHKVKALLYNSQVSKKLTERLLDIARQATVPVVGVTETQPTALSFQDWMIGQLDALDKALSEPNS
jgi:zinc/manganese transport system substrate-binding protein